MKSNASRTNTYLLILIFISAAIFVLFLWSTICREGVKLTTDNDTLNAKIELLEMHQTWTIGFMGIAIAIATILLSLLQFYFTKKAEDNVFGGLAEIASKDKEAFMEAVRMKSVELELMSDYPINIIYDPVKGKEMAFELYRLLNGYRFNSVSKPISFEAALSESFCPKSIMVFCSDSFLEDESQKLLAKNPDVGVLGYGERKWDLKHKCLNFANSPSSAYNNLMSLLHYKRYLNRGE